MISVHREYCLSGDKNLHAHVEVYPTGTLDVDIVELHEHHTTEFNNIKYEHNGADIALTGKEGAVTWQVILKERDARELSHLIADANEEYEILMRDLG
ncbi:hypothetical protein [Pseudoalteromonas luteoviolacea]|uniref:Uncharacterized protein n=1 Tax=Pseudoalteromonas luteoviolacea DSM 6061 TaxID=1365250 RepID=A0A166VMN9_9GAMM|nr:hypothetical protein [Pseudoalteromonas luteoviolacea]KZN33189.1 hypothetical protein N475_03620 [Pseudoalteromonas luteoviolacea DSM 6061]KZN53935.1 hypothetical protein N474_19015 [Pseudoalteromonas luteoviolacea CPMOR-2]MBE0385898.1 hypothetical protein [Pseudoalteromonas luteoviolacea DSM 6061]TQF70819.1 hypothetical protein FLM44_06950 [Pseudoalteromonas luteoviolacea]